LKKISLFKMLVLFGLLGVTVPVILADENSRLFVGVEGGYTRSGVDFDTTFDGIFGLYQHTVSLKASDSTLNAGFKVGRIFSPNHRTYLAFNSGGKTEHDVTGDGVHVKGE
jgi:hypothetical protein